MAGTITYRSEKDVKKRTKALLDQHGWFWWMIPANGYGKSGVSDIHALRSGVFMAIESKFGSNKPTALQVGFLNSVGAEEAFAFVVSDRNMSFFEQFLAAFDRAAGAAAAKHEVTQTDGSAMLNAIKVLTEPLA